jgi:hypothetical protein
MKFKIFLVLLISMFITASSFSQIKLSIGPEAGINISNFAGTPDPQSSSRTGLLFGADFAIGFGKYMAVQTGLRFVMKGASSTGANGTAYVDKLNYLEIPLLLKVTFPLTEVSPYLLAGPVLGINMSANEDATPNGGTTQTTDLGPFITGTDFGLLFGGGVAFKIAPKIDLFAQFGYSLGLSNILKNSTTNTLKNNGIQITAGAMFHL